MHKGKALLTAGVLCALASTLLSGCETGRVNKLHSRYEHTMDVTTSPHPNPEYASVTGDTVPIPGSPVAAGTDGLQPLLDNQARKSIGAEKGQPTPPREQAKDSFIRQQ
ncbi:MAG TPA: hypothetical protein VKT75_19925 [Acidobacteriaceae bacterium]|nr:hypothetical protein [Acidobacteriaceae bacterium]